MTVVVKVKERNAPTHGLRQEAFAIGTVDVRKVEACGRGDVREDKVWCAHGIALDTAWPERLAELNRLRFRAVESLSEENKKPDEDDGGDRDE
jgi:hypothetical protein